MARPVQGHLPIVHAGTSPRSRLFAAQSADLALVAVSDLEHAVAIREELRSLAFESGRDDRTLKVIAPVLPIVGETREHAQSIADELSELVQIAEDWPDGPPAAFPANRSLAQLSDARRASTCRSSRPTGRSRRRSSPGFSRPSGRSSSRSSPSAPAGARRASGRPPCGTSSSRHP